MSPDGIETARERITEEPGGHVLREGNAGVAFYGDVIVVVHPAEFVEPEVCGKRGRFRPDALHQATISANSINVVIENLEPGRVEMRGEQFLSNRHSYARG